MPVFIALYRGINVVGKNAVKMERLRAMHERLGHRNVASYIQSGNVIFSAKGVSSAIAPKLTGEFLKEFGFAAKLLLVDAKRWAAIVAGNPYAAFAAANPKTVHLGICDGEPCLEKLTALLKKVGGSEKFVAGDAILYLHAPDGFGTSKFAAGMERACGVPMTVRNWRTVEAILGMVKGDAEA